MKSVHPGASLAADLALTDLDEWGLWLEYFILGGNHPYWDLRAYIAGEQDWSTQERDRVILALNENLADKKPSPAGR